MLGDEIGKGAYGRVYKGLDLENGDFVAIKQVSLENIAQEDLNIIMVWFLIFSEMCFWSLRAFFHIFCLVHLAFLEIILLLVILFITLPDLLPFSCVCCFWGIHQHSSKRLIY